MKFLGGSARDGDGTSQKERRKLREAWTEAEVLMVIKSNDTTQAIRGKSDCGPAATRRAFL